jgi:hypothetical protein
LRVVRDDSLYDGDEETEGFTCTSLGLGNDVDSAQGLVDRSRLDVRHGRKLHLLGDGVDQIGVDEASRCQFLEFGDGSIFADALLRLCLCGRNLLPLCAVVEAGT